MLSKGNWYCEHGSSRLGKKDTRRYAFYSEKKSCDDSQLSVWLSPLLPLRDPKVSCVKQWSLEEKEAGFERDFHAYLVECG